MYKLIELWNIYRDIYIRENIAIISGIILKMSA